MAHRELGQFLPMLDQVEQALAIAQQLGDRSGEAAALHQLSVARSVLDEPAKGLTYSERCLAIVREVEWPVVEALVLRFLAHQYLELEQPHRAMEHAQSAVLIARRITPAPPHMGLVLQVSGRCGTRWAARYTRGARCGT
jgi:hypothetical protein